jgi:hypothetical protein
MRDSSLFAATHPVMLQGRHYYHVFADKDEDAGNRFHRIALGVHTDSIVMIGRLNVSVC